MRTVLQRSGRIFGYFWGAHFRRAVTTQSLPQVKHETNNIVNAQTAQLHAQQAAGVPHERSLVSGKVEVNGAQIAYEKTGCGKHHILLLPGALGSSQSDFKLQLDHLNKDMFTVVAWDPRGYGNSQDQERNWPEHFLERDALDAAKLMETLNIPKYSMVGWSDGGITAIIVASLFQSQVKKMVVFGANAFIGKDDMAMYDSVKDIDKWSEGMRRPMVSMYGEERLRKYWTGWINAFTRYYREHDGNICKDNLKDVLCPTLIIHGQKDAMLPQYQADYLHEHIKNSRLHNMPDGKHNLHFKYAKHFNSVVESFLVER